jgi:hypothetical protein
MNSSFARFILAAFACIALSACGQGFQARPFDAQTKDLTGAKNPSGLDFTGASNSSELEILKQAIDPSTKANLDLAASISSVVINRFDLAGNTVSAAPAKLEIRIQYGKAAKPVVYAPVLNSTRDATAVVSKDDSGATKLNVHCLDHDCTSVEVRISSGSSEAGLIYRTRSVSVEALGPFSSSTATSRLDRIGKLVSNASSPILVTTEVAWGPAMFDLHAGDIEASGDLVATGGDEENVSVQVKNEAPIDGRLIGNNNHGDLLLRFADQAAWSFLRVRLPVTAQDQNESSGGPKSGSGAGSLSGPIPPDTTPANERYIPYDTSNPITAAFEHDRLRPEIQNEIKVVSTGARANDMKHFLNRAQPNLPVILGDLKAQEIPPELLFITFVESRYFYSNYDISVSGPGAVGPWQFMLDTAKGLGLKVFEPVLKSVVGTNGKKTSHYTTNPCDQRANLDLSTKAAAKYLSSLFKTFSYDPRLAVMAYNMGAGGLNRRLNCVNQNKNDDCKASTKAIKAEDIFGLDYWTIREDNVGPRESRDYVVRFMAAQFVGRNPSKYGIKVDSTGIAPAPSPVCK